MAQFLASGIRMMQSERTRELLRDASSVKHPGSKLVDLQRAGWDTLGIDRDVGCAYLNQMEKLCPGDSEILEMRSLFVQCAQRAYLSALEDRQPKKLERRKPMPRETMVEFFDACNTKMDLPETHERLQAHLQTTGQMPSQIIVGIQRDLLEVLGFEREHGCAMLSRIGQDFPNDKELHMRFAGWRQKAQSTCMHVAKKHQAGGGVVPETPSGDKAEMKELQEKAKAEIDTMSPMERGALIQKMQQKTEVFMKLPPEGRTSYMAKLREADKLEFVKTQILLVSLMQQQWQQQQGVRDGSHQCSQGCSAHAGLSKSTVGAPSQQQMM